MSRITLTATTFGHRPSDLLGIENEYDAYCFDEAGALFWNLLKNQAVEESVKDAPKNNKKIKKAEKKSNKVLKNGNMLDFLMQGGLKGG